jgi:conjugative coupling factor TraD (TOL family)
MRTNYAFENLLRTPWEILVGMVAFGFGLIVAMHHQLVALSHYAAWVVSMPFFILAWIRLSQGLNILRYRRRLLILKPFSFGTKDVPISKENLYIGRGFKWLPIHRQRLHLLSLPSNQHFLEKSRFYRFVQKKSDEVPNSRLWKNLRRLPFLKPMSDIGGKPWLHGVGSENEKSIFLKQHNRNSHTVVFGRTRVGKTRLLSILVNQDIRNGESVLIIDPKGDLGILQDMYCAVREAGRLQDFKILHAGFPDISAKYNPLAHYSNVSEVATRVTSAIQAEGEGKQFQDFAWKFLNVVATCLREMNESISYKSLSFFVTRPRQLLLAYCDKVLPLKDSHYQKGIQSIIDKSGGQINKQGKPQEPLTRTDAVRQYVAKYIELIISKGNYTELHDSIIADLHYAAQLGEEYYGKITASLGPVFDKINKTAAGEVFSWENNNSMPVISLEEVLKKKQVVYIGLDAMTNKAMSDAIGQAVIADLISLCGRLYKEEPNKERLLNLYADEFSEIVRDEFVTLLNKAGGAGVRVTALAQTVNDIGVAFGGNADKPKMLLGNFGTRIMMRIANLDTARTFTECLEKIRARSSTPSTMSNDRSGSDGEELFTTYNTDSISEENTEIITENDVFSLPIGQAFVLANGGELFKIRIPLPKNDGDCPKVFETLLREVNKCAI